MRLSFYPGCSLEGMANEHRVTLNEYTSIVPQDIQSAVAIHSCFDHPLDVTYRAYISMNVGRLVALFLNLINGFFSVLIIYVRNKDLGTFLRK